uniref:Fibrinogen C-terminal domain-containing protein n=1 Tax=Anopheles farauti TaxID=69004 RepID=A0A182QB02_9DIPT
MFSIKRLLICVIVWSAANVESASNSNDHPSGFAFEMLSEKLHGLEYYLIEQDMKMSETIAVLSTRIDKLVRAFDNLAWSALQIGETVKELSIDRKQIARNLTVVQRDLTDLVAKQKLLVTNRQLGQYFFQCERNTTNTLSIIASRSRVHKSCSNIPFFESGVYNIHPEKPFKEPITVFCDQEYESGGWVVIQNRFDGSTNFYRNWQEYKNGFGNLEGEFWLGLDRIYQLTVSGPHELVVLLEDFDGNKTFARYKEFEIGNESRKYALIKLSGYTGTAGDSMSDLRGMKFSTFDSDNDNYKDNCAASYTGAWWYSACHQRKIPFAVSGVYRIRPEQPFKEPISVLCDQEYESGGWVVIQNRFDGSTNFYRNWEEYKNGFGNLDGEFWLGLDRIYQLTVSGPHELVVLLEDFDGNKTFARYEEFEIGSESQKYALIKIATSTASISVEKLKK